MQYNRPRRQAQDQPPKQPPRGLKFERIFSKENVSPFDQIEWDKRTAKITDDGGKVIFEQKDVEVPQDLERAGDQDRRLEVFLRRHRPRHRPVEGRARESPCGSWSTASPAPSRIGASPTATLPTEKDAAVFYDDLTWLCVNQYGAFNSPVWFNVGLYHQYGIGKNAGAGNYFYNRAAPARPSAPRPSTSTRRAAPASSRASMTAWRTSCAWPPARRCSSNTAAAPARISRRSAPPARNSPAAASRAARFPS